jgi:hypothetical protein
VTIRLRSALGILVSGILAAAAVQAAASEPGLEVHLQPTRFGVDDLVQLTIRVTEPPSDLQAPKLGELSNLEIVGGPSTGSEFSFVNGVASRSQTFTFVLRARRPGPASVGPVTVGAGGKELRADPVSAEVVEGSVAPPSRRGRRSPFTSDPFADLVPRRAPPQIEVALRHDLSTRKAVVGQPLVATVYLDSTVNSLYDFNWRTAPSYPGFWAQRLDNPDQVTPEMVEIEGTRFFRYRVLQSVLVPLKGGSFEIPAVEATIGVRSTGFFDSGQLVERSTPVRTIEVAARPPAPDGFSGAVGDLRYSASIEPAVIEYGQSAVMTIELKGRGNLPLVEAPTRFPSADDCEIYPPEEASHVQVDETGIHGSRTWQMTVVPRGSGPIELGSVDLSVFDPATGRYASQTIGPLALTVGAPPPPPTPVVTPAPADRPGVEQTAAEGRDAAAGLPPWLWIVGALVLGVGAGASATWVLGRRARTALPPRRSDQSPADRARELQLTLERWWLDARSKSRGAALEQEMQEIRRDLEAVRFAPGRADHSHTVEDLESRLKRLMRRA